MAKRSMIDLDQLDDVAGAAELKAAVAREPRKLKEFVVRGVPAEWSEILKASGHSFAGYAKIAIQEKMNRDGLL